MGSRRYAAAHADPKRAGDARPTAIQIVQDEGVVDNLYDKTILITGCYSGLRLKATRTLFETGAQLFLAARNLDKARLALRDIPDDKRRIQVCQLDQTSLDSMRKCIEEVNKAIDGKAEHSNR
jgi:enoyl-[acyl-carrier-protein] reductase (NADH)